MCSEEDACRPGEIWLKSGDCQTHAREEQWRGCVKKHIAHVEPQRLQPRHLVVGSANNKHNYRSLHLLFPLHISRNVYRKSVPVFNETSRVYEAVAQKRSLFTESSLSNGSICHNMDLKQTWLSEMDWINLVQGWDQWRALVNTAMSL
jgi:hypothetical protein